MANYWSADACSFSAVTVAPRGSSPTTICAAAEILKNHGANKVIAMATHGLLSDPAAERLAKAPIEKVVITDTLPVRPNINLDKLEVLSISKIIADAIDAVFEDTSVSEIFGGHNLA